MTLHTISVLKRTRHRHQGTPMREVRQVLETTREKRIKKRQRVIAVLAQSQVTLQGREKQESLKKIQQQTMISKVR